MLTGSTGKNEGAATYDAYGNATATTGTATTPLLYDAQYTSADTGLIYLRARTLDPKTAGFLTVDPELLSTGEAYTYAKDNPLNLGDPGGTFEQPPSQSDWYYRPPDRLRRDGLNPSQNPYDPVTQPRRYLYWNLLTAWCWDWARDPYSDPYAGVERAGPRTRLTYRVFIRDINRDIIWRWRRAYGHSSASGEARDSSLPGYDDIMSATRIQFLDRYGLIYPAF